MNNTVIFYGSKCKVKKERYADNNKPALVLIDESDGMVFTVATINIPEVPLEENEVIIKNYSENEGILDVLIENGIVEDTGKRVRIGFVTCPICVLKI